MLKSHSLVRFGLSLLALSFGQAALADSTYTGTVRGAWSSPQLTGAGIDPVTGVLTYYNNPNTAACNLAGCLQAPTLAAPAFGTSVVWGRGDQRLTNASIYSSSVTFQGATFSDVEPVYPGVVGTVFELGRITYTNGTSQLGTGIYAATLTIDIGLAGTTDLVDTYQVPLTIMSTANTGTAAQNADYLSFGSTFIQGISFNVYEGATATAIVYGRLIGDPVIQPVSIVIAPGSEGAGFIGMGVPAPIPEPSSYALMLSGLGVLACVRRRRRAIR